MRRLSMSIGSACAMTFIAGLSSAAGAAGPPSQQVLPPTQGYPQAQVKPPTCRAEPQPDSSCRTGFRTDKVCYVGNRVVSRTIGACTLPAPTRPPPLAP